ncbi:MAG: pyrroline-5-carboxylate reductase [Deltaproteobacteria bacterium]|nr:pyrroline-5-carboxylate reductase [Candidatus Anaeroferrophillacea bacterium]
MTLQQITIGIIGTGNMGRALIGGLLAGSDRPAITATDAAAAARDAAAAAFPAITTAASNREVVENSGVIILAVKPPIIPAILAEIADGLAGGDRLVISIAAGVSLATIEAALSEDVPVIRTMPSTPALIRRGVTALAAGKRATPAHRDLAAAIFARLGATVEVPEPLMNAVTAVSGSGPAYIFLVIEALLDAAVAQGIPRDLARTLVVETVAGAAAMVRETGQQPMALKDMVASPGGTTIAGLAALEDRGLRGAFFAAIGAARKRADELDRQS